MDEDKEQKAFRVSYRQLIAAKDEQTFHTFHQAGFFRDLSWVKIDHDMMKRSQ